jgi:hypothetical protein
VLQLIREIPGTERQSGFRSRDFAATDVPLTGRVFGVVVTALAALSCLPMNRAVAQVRTASITGLVVNRETREPVSGALVRLAWTGRSAVVDSAGRFELKGLAPGAGLLQIRAIGYLIGSWAVRLAEDADVSRTFEMDAAPVVLPEMLVPTSPVDNWRSPQGFEQRRSKGGGYFVTEEQLKQQHPITLVEVLRTVPGVMTSCSYEHCTVLMARSTPPCSPEYYLDGFPATLAMGPDFPIQSIRGIEVYGDQFSTPIEFQKSGLHCGVIAVWTKMER